MKTVLIGFVIVLIVLSGGLAIRYGQDAKYAQDQLNAERYKRLVTEEDLQNTKKQVGSLKNDLQKAQDRVVQMETVLEKTKTINEDLKMRLDKANEIKVNLDKKIQELQNLVLPM